MNRLGQDLEVVSPRARLFEQVSGGCLTRKQQNLD
jgi:hypothetical protein